MLAAGPTLNWKTVKLFNVYSKFRHKIAIDLQTFTLQTKTIKSLFFLVSLLCNHLIKCDEKLEIKRGTEKRRKKKNVETCILIMIFMKWLIEILSFGCSGT